MAWMATLSDANKKSCILYNSKWKEPKGSCICNWRILKDYCSIISSSVKHEYLEERNVNHMSYLQILMYIFRFALRNVRLNDNPNIIVNIFRQIVCLVFASWSGEHKITRDILGLINNWYNSWWIILVHLIIVPLTTGAPYVNCYQLII